MKKKLKTRKSKVSIKLGGKPLEIEFEAPLKPVNARRALPVFQKITNAFVQFGTNRTSESGKEVSCKAGCGACCRQPVPIGVSEAFDLKNLVESFEPERRARVNQRFEDAYRKIEEIGWLKRLSDTTKDQKKERQKLSIEYFELGIPCPFLEDESCSIHPNRPLSCREYLVTSSAENCSSPTPETIEMVELPTTPSRIFREISDNSTSDEKNYMPLISALKYAETNQEIGRKLTGEQWVNKFFESLINEQKKGLKNS